MSRRDKRYRENKHHCYPAKDTRHEKEIKVINAEAHRRWHYLVSDMTPKQAIRFIARNFMPTELEYDLLQVIK